MNDIFIIADFDHTITDQKSESSWGVLETSNLLKKENRQKCLKYKEYYLPIEKDTKISKEKKAIYLKQWLEKNLNIFIDSKLTKEQIDEISSKKESMILRKGVGELFDFTKKNNIPIIIISAGIKDVIINFLKSNNLLYNNIFILSNEIVYKDNIIAGFKHEAMHTLNKREVTYPKEIREKVKDRKEVILLGDNIEDIMMIPKNIKKAIKIGFLNGNKNKKIFEKKFDILYKEEPISEVINIIKKTHD